MSNFDYKEALKAIPHKPGVYQYWNDENVIIYIGKAKDLKNRVSSYFNKDILSTNGKTKVLVSKIRKIGLNNCNSMGGTIVINIKTMNNPTNCFRLNF